jgi:NAD(P) transhydrogenase subunit beta
MTSQILILAYIAAAILFIFGIKMLGSATTARKGNLLSSLGMLLAIVATLFHQDVLTYQWIIAGLVVGSAIGVIAARVVQMTSMPELVALFNGFGGAASMLVGWAELAGAGEAVPQSPAFQAFVIFLAIFIGGITFTGSVVAWGKLSGKLSGSPMVFAGQKPINGALILGTFLIGVVFAVAWDQPVASTLLYTFLGLSLLLGVLTVIPIGGGDMPVVISLLNSMSGLAACAAGFVISNTVLVVAGSLVGASGLILTIIMCKAMNRTLVHVVLGGFGGTKSSGAAGEGGEMKPMSVEDAYYVLEAAGKVMFVPGYGMAVAQAQHAVKELADLLEKNGCEVTFAIHPVAGRMPGHMNVLLAEADVPYEQLQEMDDANPQLPITDVAIVIGANDVVNPAATEDEGSPIYGMPIINAHHARTCFCLKRGQGTGFSGLQNRLFIMDNVRMIYGDAKATMTGLVTQFKDLK